MSVRRPIRSYEQELRAFQVDRSWYENHWYAVDEPPRSSRSAILRSSGAGLAVVSALILCVLAWQ